MTRMVNGVPSKKGAVNPMSARITGKKTFLDIIAMVAHRHAFSRLFLLIAIDKLSSLRQNVYPFIHSKEDVMTCMRSASITVFVPHDQR